MKPTNYKNLALAGITAAVLTACSSGGTCGTCAIPVPAGSKLIFVAPSILPSLANTTGINYMGVYNPTTTAISNISYSLGQAVGTGSSVTLDPASAKACANIAAKSSCFLKLSVPESTIAGGAVVTASNSDGTEAATPLAIGVQQVPYGESANANGVGLYFYPKAQYSESGVPFMLATAVVQSPNVGNINTIKLVDENGNLITGQYVTSGNAGAGAAILTMGSVVQIVVPLPQGVNLSQNYKVRTSYQSAPSTLSTIAEKLGLANKQTQATSNQTTGTQVYTVTTQGNNINLQFTPNQVYLTGINPIQYGYLYNIGDLTASQIQVSSSSPNVRVTAADQILNGQRVIKVTYELINTTVAPTTSTVTVTANNPAGQTQTSTGGTSQNVNPLPVPTPSPTPTPTPTPGPPTPRVEWSNSSSHYVVLGESTVALNSYNVPSATKVTLTDTTGDLTIMASPNDGTDNVCDFTQSAVCQVTISGGSSTSSYTVTGTATNGITVPSLAVTLSPINNYIADYGTSPSVNNGDGYIWQCQTTQPDGQIDGATCQSSRLNIGIPFAPIALAFNKIGDTQYVYIDDTGYYYGSNNIWTCTVNSTTGAINSDCVATNGGVTFQDPYNMNMYNGKVYITDWADGGAGYNVYMCTINQSGAQVGQINSCVISNGGVTSASWNPDSIAFYKERAYVADYWSGTIYTCNIDSNGLLQSCSNAGNSSYNNLSNYPTGITFSSNRAYIADWYGYQLASCDINGSGNLINCTVDVATGSGRPEQITYQGGILFAASGSSGLLACQINSSTGVISSCAATPTTSAPSWNAGQVVFNPFQ